MTPRVRLWNLVLVAWILCHPGSAVTVVEVPHTALKYGRAWNWDSPNDAIGCPHAWTNIDVASFGFSFTGARLQIYLPRRPDGGGDLLLQVDQESHIISLNDTFYTCNNVIYDGVDMPYGEHTVYAEFVKYLPDETLSVWKLQYTVPDEQVLTSLTTITTLPITTPRPISTPTRSSTSSTISSSGAVDPNPTKPPLNVGSIVGGVLGGRKDSMIFSLLCSLSDEMQILRDLLSWVYSNTYYRTLSANATEDMLAQVTIPRPYFADLSSSQKKGSLGTTSRNYGLNAHSLVPPTRDAVGFARETMGHLESVIQHTILHSMGPVGW